MRMTIEMTTGEFRQLLDLVYIGNWIMQGELDRKSEQLAVKDKQIEELNARLAEVSSALVTAQQTAAAAQALHAGTMHQQLLSGKAGADQPEHETEPVQKRSWFSRFFGD